VIAGDVSARMQELRSAAASAAEATVIALDRLIIAERVCKALSRFKGGSTTAWLEVEEAWAAWEASRPS
jgi:hypothetical protein